MLAVSLLFSLFATLQLQALCPWLSCIEQVATAPLLSLCSATMAGAGPVQLAKRALVSLLLHLAAVYHLAGVVLTREGPGGFRGAGDQAQRPAAP